MIGLRYHPHRAFVLGWLLLLPPAVSHAHLQRSLKQDSRHVIAEGLQAAEWGIGSQQEHPANPFAVRPLPSELPNRMLAHAILVKSSPERETTVTDAPDEVLLIFNDAVGEEFLALAVIDDTGKRVDKHDARLDFTDRSHLRASVSRLAPGRYTVRYRVLSADGHVVSGKYSFQVQAK